MFPGKARVLRKHLIVRQQTGPKASWVPPLFSILSFPWYRKELATSSAIRFALFISKISLTPTLPCRACPVAIEQHEILQSEFDVGLVYDNFTFDVVKKRTVASCGERHEFPGSISVFFQ